MYNTPEGEGVCTCIGGGCVYMYRGRVCVHVCMYRGRVCAHVCMYRGRVCVQKFSLGRFTTEQQN